MKVENTRGFGAEVVLEGDTFEDARVAGLSSPRSAASPSSIRSTTWP